MEIDAETALFNFPSPLSTESYSPSGYPNGVADDVMMMIEHTHPPTSMSQPPPGYGAVENNFWDPNYKNQPYAPNVTMTETIDLDSIEMLLNEPFPDDLGPPPIPVRLPRLDEEPPRHKESAYAPPNSFSNPNSPSSSDMRDLRRRTTTHLAADNLRLNNHQRHGVRNRSSKSPRGYKRATSPMFPEQSMPLATVSRQSSNSSLISTKSDPFGTISSRHSASAVSDPGVPCAVQSSDSNVNSPAVSVQGDSNSPKFTFGQTQGSQILDTATKALLELEVPMKYVRKIVDLDRKILKLQGERSKLLEKAQQVICDTPPGIEEKWPLTPEKVPEIGRVHLYVFPLGIHALDEPLYEEANSILRHIGGLYYDLQSAIGNLRYVCCKGMFILPDISTCFAYIKSLLQENQKLKLSSSIKGVYRIQLDTEANVGTDMVPQEFLNSQSAANEVLKCAQHITLTYTHIETKLLQLQDTATEKMKHSENVCQKVGIMDRERRNQIKAVLEGNCIAVASALRVWPQYYQVATETIQAVTECIHPSP